MTSTRRFLASAKSFMCVLLYWARQFQGKFCALAKAAAENGQRTAHFPGRECAAMQAEPVAALAGGEAVIENARQIFGWNSNSVIKDGYLDAPITVGHA